MSPAAPSSRSPEAGSIRRPAAVLGDGGQAAPPIMVERGLEPQHTHLSALRAELLALVPQGDRLMFERMARLFEPGQRRAAILLAGLHLPATLSSRLSRAAHFDLLRTLATAVDATVVRRRGIVGKHADGGVMAFFLAADAGSPSRAVRMAVEAAREVTAVTVRILEGALDDSAGGHGGSVRMGLHWGEAVYVGQVLTAGRLEVIAVGSEMDEAAQIERCAASGQILASKDLLDRLARSDVARLRLPLRELRFRSLGELLPGTGDARAELGHVVVSDVSAWPKRTPHWLARWA